MVTQVTYDEQHQLTYSQFFLSLQGLRITFVDISLNLQGYY